MAGNPFDQFDASASAAPAAGGNPFDRFDPKGATAKTAAPSDTDYSSSPFSAAARTLAESAGLGAGDLIYSHLAGTSLAHEQAKTEAAAASLPWYVRYPLEATGYTLGAGSLLSGVPEAAGITGVGAMALEGGLAGGASSILHSNDPSLGGVLAGAAGGAALGGAAGGLTKGVNVGLQKALGKAASVDPATAIASTAKDSADAYAALHQEPADPQAVGDAISNVMSNLDLSVRTGMSPGLKSTINDIHAAVQTAPDANMGQVDSFQRQINAAAQRERYPTDKVVAGKLDDALGGLIQKGGAGDLQDTASAAAQQKIMAENLAKWTATTKAGGSLGQAPLTEAENWYQGKPQYKDLVNLYQTNQGMMDPSYSLAHMGGGMGAMAGYPVAGPVGGLVGHQIGYQLTKNLTKGAVKKYKTGNMLKALTAAYPSLTGVQPTGAVQAPQIGEQIKNLMLGGAY